jgi:hypothetical protein
MGNHSAVMRISYRFTADFVFLVHLTLVCVVAVGWLIPQLFYLHLTLLLATLCSEIFLGYCILTRMEYAIRHKLDPMLLFDKSCIVHYLRKWRGLAPRPIIITKPTFFRKNSFLFILISLAVMSFGYNFLFGYF